MNNMSIKIIELGQCLEGKKVISGRKYGKELREKLKINEIDNSTEDIKIIIPKDIFSFNSSCFLGMFGESVRKLGSKEKFLEKFIFDCSEIIKINIDDGISDALNNMNALED